MMLVPPPSVSGPAGYYYATGFDSGNGAGSPGATVSAQFLVEGQTSPNYGDHSVTEMYVNDTPGNAAEVGIITDPGYLGTAAPVLFATSWTKGSFNGFFDNGYRSTVSAIRPGATEPRVGTWAEFGFSYSKGRLNVTYNGRTVGYFPSSFWSGGWVGNAGVQVYGEAYNAAGGDPLPTMNGAVRDFRSSWRGRHLTYVGSGVSIPYKITSRSGTGFTFSGPYAKKGS